MNGSPPSLPHEVKGLLLYSWLSSPLGITLMALLAVLACFALWRLARRWWQKRSQRIKKAEHPLVLVENAVRALGVPSPYTPKAAAEYFFSLSMLLRQAIELASGLAATDLTLQELKAVLVGRTALGPAVEREVLGFCERADLVKFAEAPSQAGEAEEWRTRVLAWCESLRSHTVQAEAEAAKGTKER